MFLQSYLWCVASQHRPATDRKLWQPTHCLVHVPQWPLYGAIAGVLGAAVGLSYAAWHAAVDVGVAATAVALAAAGFILGAAAVCAWIAGYLVGAELPRCHIKAARRAVGLCVAVLFMLLSPLAVALGLALIVVPLLWACVISAPAWLADVLLRQRPVISSQQSTSQDPHQVSD